jgi:glycosyltransferase involved in cell wall biosynthesis
MKIAYITNQFGATSETFVSELVTELSIKADIYVFCKTNLNPSQENLVYYTKKKEGLVKKLILLDKGLSLGLKYNICSYYKVSSFLSKKSLKQLKPDIAYIDFGLNAAEYLDSLKFIGIPFIVHFHGLDITSSLSNQCYRKYLNKIFISAKAIIAASYHIKRLLILEGCNAEKIHIVRCGVSIGNYINPIAWRDKNQDTYEICFLGRLTPKKNPKALILMLKKISEVLSNVKLNIIGDGIEKANMFQLIQELNLEEKIKYHGALPKEEAMKVLNNCHVYVQHSVTPLSGDQEGWALSISEASLLGIPVVSTIHGGITENVIDGQTGFLVPEYNYEAMAQKVIYLLKNPRIAEMIGKAGRDRFRNTSEFTTSYRANRIYEICQTNAIN